MRVDRAVRSQPLRTTTSLCGLIGTRLLPFPLIAPPCQLLTRPHPNSAGQRLTLTWPTTNHSPSVVTPTTLTLTPCLQVRMAKNTLLRVAIEGDKRWEVVSPNLESSNLWFFVGDDIKGTFDGYAAFLKVRARGPARSINPACKGQGLASRVGSHRGRGGGGADAWASSQDSPTSRSLLEDERAKLMRTAPCRVWWCDRRTRSDRPPTGTASALSTRSSWTPRESRR